MIFMGALFRKEHEKNLLDLSKVGITNAANTFQWNIIEGLVQNGEKNIHIINALPVGVWPRQYKKMLLNDEQWEYLGNRCFEIGALNIPIFKQLYRTIKAKRIVREFAKNENEIIIYSTYVPFLKALYKLPKTIKITAVIADIPEHYDLAQRSSFRKLLLKMQTKIMYKYMKRIDRFVLLTEQMTKPLNVGDRPYTVVEGIFDDSKLSTVQVPSNDKKIIFYSGSLKCQFGIKTLLDAFGMLKDQEAELWICGAGEAENEIKEMSQKDKRIKFYGFLPLSEVEKLRAQASVLVNPRTNDGEYTKYSFPSKTMEYMASGVPVVMYKLDGVPDEYDEYLTYIKDDSVDTMAQTLSNILALPAEERLSIGARARAFVLENKNKKIQSFKILNFICKKTF